MSNFFSKLLYGGGIVFDLFKWIILVIVVLVLVNKFLITIFFVDGLSMFPTLKDKELVLLQKNSYSGAGNPQRGDIVAVKYPGDPDHKRYVKRVVGLPGDKVSVVSGRVYINDQALSEDYLVPGLVTEPDGQWQIPDGSYFLMGDNRPGSNDSRYFGPVEKRFISGHAIAVIFPRAKNLTRNY